MPNPVAPEGVNRYRSFLPVTGKRPCAVIPVLRRRYCKNPEAHYADIQITFGGCGHKISWCDNAFAIMSLPFSSRVGRKQGATCPVCRRTSTWYHTVTRVPRS